MRRIALRPLVLTALAIALSGCAATNSFFPGSSTSSTGTVTGHVQIHACPGPLAADECPARPAPGVAITFKPSGSGQAVTAKTDSAGAYSATIPVGTYSIVVGSRSPGAAITPSTQSPCPPGILANPVGCPPSKFFRAVEGPSQITVHAGQTTTADFSITIPMV
jgi:hypothetical protein